MAHITTLVWFFWLMSNDIIFNDRKFVVTNILNLIKSRTWLCIKVKVEDPLLPFSCWCTNPISCILRCCQIAAIVW